MAEQPEQVIPPTPVRTTADLNIRREPDMTSERIGLVAKGTTIGVDGNPLEVAIDGWLPVTVALTGWVSGEWVDVLDGSQDARR